MQNCTNLECTTTNNTNPYKITYVYFEKGFKVANKLKLYSSILEIKNNAMHDTRSYLEIINDINIKYIQLMNIEEGFQLKHYIFVGKLTSEIRAILTKIQNTKQYPTNTENLDTYFKYNCKEKWGLLNKYSTVTFIDAFIKNDDTIFNIKNNIFYYLSTKTDILSHDKQFLTCQLTEDYYKLIDTDTNIHSDIVNYYIQNIYKRILSRKGGLTYSNLIQEFSSIGIFANIETYRSLYPEINTLKYENLSTDTFLRLYLETYIKNITLTHRLYSTLNTNVYINPYIFNCLTSDYYKNPHIAHNMEHMGNIKVNFSNQNNILYSFGNIVNNEIFLYNFSNIHNYITTNNILDLSDTLENKLYFQYFVNKYFPTINETNYTQISTSTYKTEEHSKIKDLFHNINPTILNLSNLLENIGDLSNSIYIKNTCHLNSVFEYNLNVPFNLDIISIFNEIQLSYEIPFVKLKDPNTREMVYKIYKHITQKETQFYLPIIDKDTLHKWIKFSGYEYTNGILNELKGKLKNIQYKLKLFNIPLRNKTFIGIIYKINYNETITLDIHDKLSDVIYSNVDLNFLIKYKGKLINTELDMSVIKIGDEVEYYKYETKYADVIITKHGKITFDVNWQSIFNINIEDIIDKLVICYNYFIDKIASITLFKSYSNIILPINSNILYLNASFLNVKAIYNVTQTDISIPDNIILSSENIMSLLKCFFPYISIVENSFSENQEIEYYVNEEGIWKAGLIQNIVSGNRYNIITIPNKEELTNFNAQNIRAKGGSIYSKYISVKYKRISQFDKVPPIISIIKKKFSQGFGIDDIMKVIIEQFDISINNANKIVMETIDVENPLSLTNIKNNSGIDIKINYLEYKKQDSENIYKIYIEGYRNILELQKINYFIVNFFNTYLIQFHSKSTHITERFNTLYNISLVKCNIYMDNTDELNINKEVLDMPSDSVINWSNNDDEDFDDFDDFDSQSSLSKAPLEDVQDDNALQASLDIFNSEHIYSDIKRNISPNLARLYQYDNDLFGWTASSDWPSYSKGCQGNNRYPKVVSDKHKKYIDTHYPNSYNETDIDIDCDNNTDLHYYSKKPKCKAIKAGSSDDIQNWYMCPRIWDLKDNIPLKLSDLIFNSEETFESSHDDWRKDKTTGKDILDFNPTFKGRSHVDVTTNDIVVTLKKSLLFENKRIGNRYPYPGFLAHGKHPKGIPVPCCFKGNSKRMKNVFGTIEPNVDQVNDYIQGSAKILGWNPYRIGLLPEQLYKYFGMNTSDCKTGELDISKQCFLRRGIKQSNKSFLSLIANLHNDMADSDLI